MDALTGPAERYGQALMEMAVEQGELETVTRDLALARSVFAQPELAAFMGSPAVPRQAKMEILETLFAGKIGATLLTFLKVIVDRRSERQLPGIIQAAHYRCLARQGIDVVFVTTPYPLDDSLRHAIEERLASVLKKRLFFEYRVNKNLIGGLVIRRGDELLDLSVFGMLRRLREMLETSVKLNYER